MTIEQLALQLGATNIKKLREHIPSMKDTWNDDMSIYPLGRILQFKQLIDKEIADDEDS